MPGAGGARPGVGVGAADGVLCRSGDPGGGEQVLVLDHRLGDAPLDHRRDALLVELALVADGAGDESGRPLQLRLLGGGVPEQEEEVGVEGDPVPAAQIAVRPEGVEPAVDALGGVVLLQCRVQHPAGAAGSEEGGHLRLGLSPFVGGQQRRAPGEEPFAAGFQCGQRHPREAVLLGEGRHGGPFLTVIQFCSLDSGRGELCCHLFGDLRCHLFMVAPSLAVYVTPVEWGTGRFRGGGPSASPAAGRPVRRGPRRRCGRAGRGRRAGGCGPRCR